MHVVEPEPGHFEGWSDDAVGMDDVESTYGELMKVKLLADGKASFELGAFTGMCCSYTLVGTIAQDGSAFDGEGSGGSLRSIPDVPQHAALRKIQGDSCVAASRTIQSSRLSVSP
jgi:hypothetical protein